MLNKSLQESSFKVVVYINETYESKIHAYRAHFHTAHPDLNLRRKYIARLFDCSVNYILTTNVLHETNDDDRNFDDMELVQMMSYRFPIIIGLFIDNKYFRELTLSCSCFYIYMHH